jgi:HlyD family secretion protein
LKRVPWFWVIVIAALGLGLVWGRAMTAQSRAVRAPAAQPSRTRPPAPQVGVAHPKRATIPVTISLTANISSLRSAVIYTKTAGYLLEVRVRPGDSVKAGQVVAIVDHSQLDTQVAQAQAALASAQSGVQTAEAAVATARAQYQNAEAAVASARANLANTQAGVAKAQAILANAQETQRRTADLVRQGAEAQQNLDDATAQAQTALADLNAASAQVRVAQAQVAQAQAQVAAAAQQVASATSQVHTQEAQVANQQAALQNAQIAVADATIRAPFGGIVVSRSLDPGAYVTPGTSTPILQIADLSQMDVLVNVTEVQLGSLRVGAPVQIQVDAYPGRTFQGRVSRIAGGIDPMTRTVQAEIDVPNPGHLLRPGMYAAVSLAAGEDTNVLVIPLAALTTVGDQHSVWVVTDNVAHQRSVTVGRAVGDQIEITGGLSDGDLIVARGVDLVREGQRVQGVPVGL